MIRAAVFAGNGIYVNGGREMRSRFEAPEWTITVDGAWLILESAKERIRVTGAAVTLTEDKTPGERPSHEEPSTASRPSDAPVKTGTYSVPAPPDTSPDLGAKRNRGRRP